MQEKYTPKPPPEVEAENNYWAEQRKATADYFARLYDPNYGKQKTTPTSTPTYPAYPGTPAQQQAYDPQLDAIAKYFDGTTLATE